jgi:hypothetical protein
MNSFITKVIIFFLVVVCAQVSYAQYTGEAYDIQRNNGRYGYGKVWTPKEAQSAVVTYKETEQFRNVYTLHCTPQGNLISVYNFSRTGAFSSNVIYRATQQQVFCDPSNGRIYDPKNLADTVR